MIGGRRQRYRMAPKAGSPLGDLERRERFAYLVLQDLIERLDDSGRVPPLGSFHAFCDHGRTCAALRLNLAHRAETSRGERLFEFAVSKGKELEVRG